MKNFNLSRNIVNPTISENVLYVDLLQNRIWELENQLTEKTAVISHLTIKLITKSQNTSVDQNSRNIGYKKEP